MSKRAGEFITLDELLAEVGRRRRSLVLRLARGHVVDRLRHRAREETVQREPRLLRPVRPRKDRVDPAQGDGGRARAGVDGRRDARRRPGGRPRAGGRSPTGSRRGRGHRGRDPRHHDVCDAARDRVPCVLSRRPCRRSGRSGPVGLTPRPRPGDAGHAREDARAARDLSARVDVGRGGPAAAPRPAASRPGRGAVSPPARGRSPPSRARRRRCR